MMSNADRVKLEKVSQEARMSEQEQIQYSIAVSLKRIADKMDKFYDDGITVTGT
jgi:hypothetical protein